jgi:DUF4097 and DUF4098 domain-containing protein YvlB
LVLLVLAASCSGPHVDHSTSSRRSIAASISSVVIDADNASIDLQAASTSVVHWTERWSRHAPKVTVSDSGGTLTVTSRCPLVPFNRCSVTIVASVPARARARVKTVNGEVRASGLTGAAVDVTTTNGRIALSQLAVGETTSRATNGAIELEQVRAGSIEGRTRNGEVIARLLGVDDVAFQTTNGGIDATLPAPHRAAFTTTNGNIQVRLPAGSYALDVRATNGRTSTDGLVEDPASDHRVAAHTTNGSVTLGI